MKRSILLLASSTVFFIVAPAGLTTVAVITRLHNSSIAPRCSAPHPKLRMRPMRLHRNATDVAGDILTISAEKQAGEALVLYATGVRASMAYR